MNLYFAYFLIGHLLGDFFFQTNYIAKNKTRPVILFLHIFIVFLATLLIFLPYLNHLVVWGAILVNTIIHYGLDYYKINKDKKLKSPDEAKPLFYFWIDQLAHFVTFTCLAYFLPLNLEPGLFANSWWYEYYTKPNLLYYVAGFLLFSYMTDIIIFIERLDKGDFTPYNRNYYNMIRRTFIFAVMFLVIWYFIKLS